MEDAHTGAARELPTVWAVTQFQSSRGTTGKENTMTPTIEDHQRQDEFAPIELGSVSSETKGAAEGPAELSGSQNSRPGIG